MFDIIKLIIALLVILIIGRSLLKLIIKDKHTCLSEKFALSFGLGIGTLSTGMFLLSFIGLTINLLNILLLTTPFIVYLISGEKFKTGRMPIDIRNKLVGLSPLQIILIIFILFTVFLVFSDALTQPMVRWDDRVIWGLKAKILYYDESIYSNGFLDADTVHPHKNYPLLIPLTESWIYIVIGHVDDRLVKIVFPLFFTCILLIFYSSLRKFSSNTYSLIFTTLLTSMPFIIVSNLPLSDAGTGAASGYADTPLSFFYFVSTVYLYMWMVDNVKRDYLIISSVFSIFVVFTKSEGIILFLGNLSAFVVFILVNKVQKFKSLSVFLLPFVVLLPWFIFQQMLTNDFIFQYSVDRFIQNLYRLPIILDYILKIFLDPLNWSVLWILLALSTCFTIKSTFKKPMIYLFLMILSQLLAIVLMYELTPADVERHMSASMNRMLTHVVPTVLFLVSIQIFVGKLLLDIQNIRKNEV